MKLIGIENHEMKDKYPCRLPVWWGNIGDIGAHPDIKGVTGRKVILRIEKRFTRIERLMAKVFRSPREVRRPLDWMNSLLWELCDGNNTFEVHGLHYFHYAFLVQQLLNIFYFDTLLLNK